jgi:hypothetical protein
MLPAGIGGIIPDGSDTAYREGSALTGGQNIDNIRIFAFHGAHTG